MMAGSQDVESAPGFRRGFLKGQRDLQEKHGQHFLKITDPSHADQTRRGFSAFVEAFLFSAGRESVRQEKLRHSDLRSGRDLFVKNILKP
jgi:hypothetical protein